MLHLQWFHYFWHVQPDQNGSRTHAALSRLFLRALCHAVRVAPAGKSVYTNSWAHRFGLS